MEWKELKIDNLPPDILTGDYEFMFLSDDDGWEPSGYNGRAIHILRFLIEKDGQNYRYRKPEPKAPSHEEIMIKWWQMDNPFVWRVVTGYNRESNKYLLYDGWCSIEYFIGRESVDIPPKDNS